MDILFVHIRFPEFDRCSGDLRLSGILKILAKRHKITLLILYKPQDYVHAAENKKYFEFVQELGIDVKTGSLRAALKAKSYDLVLIEFYYVAHHLFNDIRSLQPRAKVVVDTEHIYFYSNHLKAKALGEGTTSAESLEQKERELGVYQQSDVVLTVTEEDKSVLLAENPDLVVEVIPNIHEAPRGAATDIWRQKNSLIFVGNFSNNPSNSDAMVYFCKEIFPLIKEQVPDVSLRIVGNQPGPDVMALAGDSVAVTGYVPETSSYLWSGMVSICPLRYGAGLKGKVGEAMIHGLPVVTTSVGAQGMDARHREHLMVADTPEQFARCVVELLRDESLWQKLSRNGRTLVAAYSPEAVEARIDAAISRVQQIRTKELNPLKRLILLGNIRLSDLVNEHLLWRFAKKTVQPF